MIEFDAFQELSPGGKIPEEIHEIANKEGWTAFVNACLLHFHENGIQPDQIIKFIHEMPYVEGAIDMLKTLKNDLNADIIIISDANSVYINESLTNAGVRDLISEIYTNPAEFDEKGQLIMKPFANQTECDLSARNLCKGTVMLNYMKDNNFDFVFYAGDGGNDFCPMEKLTDQDIAFVRKGYALEKKIPRMRDQKGLPIKADIFYWTNSHEIIAHLRNKINSKKWYLKQNNFENASLKNWLA